MAKEKNAGKTVHYNKDPRAAADNAEEKKKALDLALSNIEKQFGKGSIMKLGQTANMNVQVIPSGCLELDIALGVGGIPKGRIIEIYGPESSGKTTMALHMVAQAQKLGGTAAFIDAEHALDPVYAKALGVNIDELYVSQPDTGEQALRKLAGIINKTNSICIFINQLREKVGVMFGNPETTAGGKALKFYATIRLDVRRTEQIKKGTEAVGNRVKVKVVKNKVAPPFRVAEFDMLYGKGVSHEGSVLDLGVQAELINKSGAYFSYNGERIGQGRENARQYLTDHPDICDEIEQKIRQSLAAASAEEEGAAPQEGEEPAFGLDEQDEE